MIASSSAITTRVGRLGSADTGLPVVNGPTVRPRCGRGASPAPAPARSTVARSDSAWRAWASAWRRASRASTSASGRLRHQRPEADVLRLLLEEAQLLLGDRELGPDPFQAFADVDQAALEEGLRHRRGTLDPGVLKHIQLVADTDNTVIRRIAAFLIVLGALALSPVAAHAADDPGRDPLTLAKQRLDAARAEATDISGRISAAQTDEAKLEAEISAAEANIPQLRARATELKAIVKQRAAQLYVRYGETAAFESAMEAENAEDGLPRRAPHRHAGHAGSRRGEQAAGDRGRARGT